MLRFIPKEFQVRRPGLASLGHVGAAGLLWGLVACSPTQPPSSTGGSVSVVATTSVLCDLTRQIAETSVALTCLVPPGQDPHTYEVTPGDRKALESANLVLYGGYGLEPGVVKALAAKSQPVSQVAVYEQAVPQPLRGGHDHHDHDTGAHEGKAQAKGAEAEAVDPHVWHNAQNGSKIVAVIAAQLSQLKSAQLNPAQRDRYAQNAKALTARLNRLDGWIRQQIASIPPNSRQLVTTHDALGYYGQAYGIPIQGALQGLSTDQQPTPTALKTLVEAVKATRVPTVFVEQTANPALMQTVAKEAGVKISSQPLYADGLGEAGSPAATYEQMLIANTQTIVEGLGGQFQPFKP